MTSLDSTLPPLPSTTPIDHWHALAEIVQAVAQSPRDSKIIDTCITQKVAQLLKIAGVALWRLIEANSMLVLSSFSIPDRDALASNEIPFILKISATYQQVMRQNKPIFEKRMRLQKSDPRKAFLPSTIKSTILPIHCDGQVAALLELSNPTERLFNNEEQSLLSALAAQLSVVFDSLALSTKAFSNLEYFKSLQVFSTELQLANSANEVLDCAAQTLCRQLNLASARFSINLVEVKSLLNTSSDREGGPD